MSAFLERNKHGYPWLLGALTALFVAHGLAPGPEIVQIAGINVILLAILVATVHAVAQARRNRVVALGLAVGAFGLSWLQLAVPGAGVPIAMHVCYIGFFALTGMVILRDVFSHGDVDGAHIAGAICVYLLMGVLGGFLFSLIGLLDPDAFRLAESATAGDAAMNQYFYFSFVTLTTVGYGDIVPVAKVARSLATMLAVFGQVYLAVLIAGLVSRSIASRARRD